MPYGIFFQKFTVGQPGMTGFGASNSMLVQVKP
jgi:hypothetical protein